MLAIGDIVERCLRFFGITKDRVQAAIGNKDCGCSKRQAAMNEWGYRWQHRIWFACHALRQQSLRLCGGKAKARVWVAARHFRLALRALFYGIG